MLDNAHHHHVPTQPSTTTPALSAPPPDEPLPPNEPLPHRDPASRTEVANRLLDIAARKQFTAFSGRIPLDDLRSLGVSGALEAIRKWDGRGQFEAFAMQRIQWAVLRGVRREILRDAKPEVGDETAALLAAQHTLREPEGLSQDVEHDAERIRLRRAIQDLPAPEDAVMARHCYLDESFIEIADALGLRRSTVHDAYHRARSRLEHLFGPRPEATAHLQEPEIPRGETSSRRRVAQKDRKNDPRAGFFGASPG